MRVYSFQFISHYYQHYMIYRPFNGISVSGSNCVFLWHQHAWPIQQKTKTKKNKWHWQSFSSKRCTLLISFSVSRKRLWQHRRRRNTTFPLLLFICAIPLIIKLITFYYNRNAAATHTNYYYCVQIAKRNCMHVVRVEKNENVSGERTHMAIDTDNSNLLYFYCFSVTR